MMAEFTGDTKRWAANVLVNYSERPACILVRMNKTLNGENLAFASITVEMARDLARGLTEAADVVEALGGTDSRITGQCFQTEGKS